MKHINFNGKFSEYSFITDDDIYEMIKHKKFYPNYSGYPYVHTYVQVKGMEKGKGKSVPVYLHRSIMNSPQTFQVDHIDGNVWNCQRSNLRLCLQLSNSKNRKKDKSWHGRSTSSHYKGVSWVKYGEKYKKKGIWISYIYNNGNRIVLGFFDDEIEAARAYNTSAIILHGEFAKLNVI
jgi:hypothetical protein